MKSTLTALAALGLVLGLATPTFAAGTKTLSIAGQSDAKVIYQQSTCKTGEMWDVAAKKCKKK